MSEEFKKGDRVRVTIEGEVVGTGATSFRLLTRPGQIISSSAHVRPNEPGVTVEKLTDPEPEWVNGDVVKIGLWLPAYRVKGDWVAANHGYQHYMLSADPDIVSKSWQSGDLKILYKADAEREGAEPVREVVLDCEEVA